MNMKFIRTIVLLMITLCISTANAQSRPSRTPYYFLYSSQDRVYYNNQDNWKLVYYEETFLNNEFLIKTNAPFTVKDVNSSKILFCPEAKEAKTLRELINLGGKRNEVPERTHGLASMIDLYSLGGKRNKRQINYLLIGNDKTKEIVYSTGSRINDTLRADTNLCLGYNKVLLEKSDLSKDSILKSLKSLSDSIDGRSITLYFSCNGLKDMDGNYHFITSDTKYDTLTCKYVNTLPADTLNTYIELLRAKRVDVRLFVDTDHPHDFIHNISNMENSCAYIWTPGMDDLKIAKNLFRSFFYRPNYSPKNDPGCNVRYLIREKIRAME